MQKIKSVAINAWILKNKNIDGIGVFTIETTLQLAKINPNITYHVLTDWDYKCEYFNMQNNIVINKIFPPKRHPILYLVFLETVLPIFLYLKKIDVFVGMDGMLSLVSRKKQISIIHDLNFVHYPEFLPFRNRVFYRILFPYYARKSDAIATVSEFTKQDIVLSYRIPSEKITVVYCAAKNIFHPISETEKYNIKINNTSNHPYFIYIGTIHPRKNLENTLKAFEIFTRENKNFKLVLIGNQMWNNKNIHQLIFDLKIKKQVIIKGRLSDCETNDLLAGAEALLFMSYFEGFGIPILEAFATETPVICSNTTSLNEISGDAALTANPKDPSAIADNMLKLIGSRELRGDLIQKGIKRNKDFSWEKTSMKIFNIIASINGN
jgi:glycosyltransferase involved in cell wall biosynthesis